MRRAQRLASDSGRSGIGAKLGSKFGGGFGFGNSGSSGDARSSNRRINGDGSSKYVSVNVTQQRDSYSDWEENRSDSRSKSNKRLGDKSDALLRIRGKANIEDNEELYRRSTKHRRDEIFFKPLDSRSTHFDADLPTPSEEVTAGQSTQSIPSEATDAMATVEERSDLSSPKPKDFIKPKINTVSGTRRSRRAHDELRRRQISQPLRAVVPRWPTEMTPADKQLFKACVPAIKLLIKLGYANDTNW